MREASQTFLDVCFVLGAGALTAVALQDAPPVSVTESYVGDEAASSPLAEAPDQSVLAVAVGENRSDSVTERVGSWGPLPSTTPWDVTVENRVDETREFRVEISQEGTNLFSRTVSLGPNRTVDITLQRPDEYVVSVSGESVSTVFRVAPEWFDCNDPDTTLSLYAETAETETWRNLGTCASPP